MCSSEPRDRAHFSPIGFGQGVLDHALLKAFDGFQPVALESTHEFQPRLLHHTPRPGRPESEPFESLVVAEEDRQSPAPYLFAGGRPATVDEARDLGVTVELDQV